MRQKNKRPVNWMLRTAAILMCLVAASLYLVTGLYARYTTSTTASDGARVAKFEVEMGWLDEEKAVNEPGRMHANPFQVTIKPGDVQTRKVTVKNSSEVAVECVLTAENESENLPLELKWENIDGGSATHSVNLAANQTSEQTYTLYIVWPNTDAEDKSVKYSREVDHIVVTILCQQID